MIRHSSAFLISIILHILLVFLFFLGYKTILQKESIEKSSQQRMQIELCTISPVQVIKPTKVKEPEKIIEKTTISKKEIKKVTLQPKTIKQLPVKKKQASPKTTIVLPTNVLQNKPSTLTLETEKEKSLRLQKEYLNKHLEEITKLLSENLYYPRSARKRGITDVVVVKFTLSRLGEVLSLQIIESKTKVLSRAAKETINNLSGQFPKPDEALTLHVPIEYKLKK